MNSLYSMSASKNNTERTAKASERPTRKGHSRMWHLLIALYACMLLVLDALTAAWLII